MAERVEITNEETARAWLETQDHQTQVWFAARTALRTLPNLVVQPVADARQPIFAVFRSLLIACAAANQITPDTSPMRNAAAPALRSAQLAQQGAYAENDTAQLAGVRSVLRSAADAVGAILERSEGASNLAARATRYAGAGSLAYDANEHDANNAKSWSSLWPPALEVEDPEKNWAALKNRLARDGDAWRFWINWYQRLLTGQPVDWNLINRIATEISDEEWQSGPERVAERIEQLREAFDPEPLDQNALRAHLSKLVKAPDLFADSAESASNLIADAIYQFKNEEPQTNSLPDGYHVFEELPGQFTQISVILRSSDGGVNKTEKLQEEINRLNALVQQLQFDLASAQQELNGARLSAIEAQQTRTFGERLQTTLTNITLVGAIGMTALNFFGVTAEDLKYDVIKEGLQGLAKEMEKAEPSPDFDVISPTTEI